MSDTLVFSSARLLSFSRKHTGGTAKFSSAISSAVMKAFKWEDVPEGVKSAKLEGTMHASDCLMAPDEDGLKRQKFSLSIGSVGNFEVQRLELEGKKKKGYRLELRFDIDFTDREGAAKLEKYMLVAGEAKAKLTVTYVPQTEMELVTEEQRQAVLPEND